MARSTFVSQNAQNTSLSEPFLKFRCSKMARRCGAKHICKSNAQNTSLSEPFLKFRCSKMARHCGARHICKSKCTKHLIVGAIFKVPMFKKWHTAVARSTFASENVKKLTGTDHFLNCRCGKIARRCGAKRACKSKCTKNLRFAAF